LIRQLHYQGAPRTLIAETQKIRQEVNSDKLPPGATVSLLGDQVPVVYLTDLNRRDEVGIARHLHVPILIMHGGRDWQVADQDIDVWRSGFKGVVEVSFRQFSSLNHFFIAGSGAPRPAEYLVAGHVDKEVVAGIADFILQQQVSN
jgi:hypothetical protein